MTRVLRKRVITEPNWVFVCLLAAFISSQLAMHSFSYLAGVTSKAECSEVCKGEILPLCKAKPGSSEQCNECYMGAGKYDLKQATCLDENEFSILVSYGFILVFAVCGLVAGTLADRHEYSRRNIVMFACVGWSLAVALQSQSNNFAMLLVSRMLLGGFTSFAAPASFSALADVYPNERLATVNGTFSLGMYLGLGLASVSMALAHEFGWREVSLSIAGFGLLCALMIYLLISEPMRRDLQPEAESSDLGIVGAMKQFQHDPVLVLVICGSTLRLVAAYSFAAYLPQFFKLYFAEQNTEFALVNAGVVCFVGGLSSVLGGNIADRLEEAFGKWSVLALPVFGSLLGLAAMLACLNEISNFTLTCTWLALSILSVECWLGPSIKLVQERVPKQSRASAVALILLVGALVGNLGPIVIGHLLDRDVAELHDILSVVAVISYFGCSVLLGLASLLIYREHDTFPPPQQREPLLQQSEEEEEEESIHFGQEEHYCGQHEEEEEEVKI